MKLTHKVIIASIWWFVIWVLGTAGYELWTLFNNVPNDTISHAVAHATPSHPWLPVAFVGFGGLFVIFWITVVLHWWGLPTFWWKPAKFVDENDSKIKDSK